jgi:hypothetical protein
MQDLINELNEYRQNLDRTIGNLETRGKIKAKAERDYRIALAKKILELRANGIPVSIINDLARGDEKIANLKMKRDIEESLYESNMQRIYECKINIDWLQSQIEAERKGE